MATSAKKQQDEERKAPIYARRRRLAEIRGEVADAEESGEGETKPAAKKTAKRAKR